MATAYVSGAWAVLKQAELSGTVDHINQTLKDTGKPIPSATAKRIQVDAALAKLLCPNNNTICVIGKGKVKSIGSAVNSVCSNSTDTGTTICPLNTGVKTLVAIPDTNYTLAGWGGRKL
ncbi:MAG: hypothetical protein HC877_23220 [Thioploca sp.]|nr:hypothetical protein [Thioploca sp.]